MADLKTKDYEISKEVKTAEDKKQEAKEFPSYMDKLPLSKDQKDRLRKEFEAEIDVIKKQREGEGNDSDNLDKKWEALQAQYEGKIKEDTRRMFNLNMRVTKIKVDKCVNLVMQAFFESDPIFSISPRPEYDKDGGREVCDKQEGFLDYKLDNLPFRVPVGLAVQSAVVKGTGILKIYHDIKRMKRQREESYDGKLVPRLDDKGMPISVNEQAVMYNKGLEEFLKNWPSADKDYPGYVKDLTEGKKIDLVVKYKDTVYNDPRPKYVELKDFYVRRETDGYEGLRTTRMIGERINYTYWELEQEERKGNFEDIDQLVQIGDDPNSKVKDYANKSFDIFEVTYYFNIDGKEDGEEDKIKFWISEEKKIILGAVYYPNSTFDSEYVPFYIKNKKTGFYQPGLAEDTTDTNIAENLILNHALEGAYQRNMVTPITDSEEVEEQFLEKRFTHGVPIRAKPGSIDFLQKYMGQTDTSGLIGLMQYLVQVDDNVTKISSLMSGKESPVDPTAPASKTIALLQQSGIDVKEYILAISPSFNQVAYILLGMYFQISKEGRKYSVSVEKSGVDPFQTIERNELVARTNIQARAYAFDFDKINEKTADVALYQLIRQEPLLAKRPESVYFLLKNIIESWSPKWKNSINKLLPPIEQFKQEQASMALMAVAQYMKMKQDAAQTTGVAPEFKAEELMPMMNDLMAEAVTNPPEEVLKEREKANVR